MTGIGKRWALAGLAGLGAVTTWLVLAGWLGPVRSMQLMVSLVVPATVMIGFWLAARDRIDAREAEIGAILELEHLGHRAKWEFLSAVSHELPVHRELCSLRAEALAVAIDYRRLCPELKVAVPDLLLVTDPNLLRLVLHVLVGNAVRHGGPRVAIWATPEDGRTRVSVSDDGPGLAPESETRVFERLVDLAERRPGSALSGLSLARALGDLIGGELSYRRDRTWSHFSLLLPARAEHQGANRARPGLEAGVR
jgi:hypothetical protein